MEKDKIGFLYSVRHEYPDPDRMESLLEADFDDPATIEEMIKQLKEAGYDVVPIEVNEEAYLRLYENREELSVVLNYSEGLRGRDREAHLPAMMEMLGISYTGSRPLTQALVLHKAKTKEILGMNGIPVLPGQVMKSGEEMLKKELNFPLIVKPLAQGSSAGITNESVVDSEEQLRKQVKKVLDVFGGEVLLEPFIGGREFSVGMVGNPPRVLPIIEALFNDLPEGYKAIDSAEVKWVFEDQGGEGHLVCPADIDEEKRQKIEKICLEVWEALEIEDVCRVDLREDEQGNIYVLEVNSPAGLLPPKVSMTSYLPLAARAAGIEYKELLKILIEGARKRLGGE